MPDAESIVPYRPGLEGVTAGISGVSDIVAEENKLLYRGYDIRELAENSEFEEVAYLVLYGELPNATQLSQFKAELVANREVPEHVYQALRALPKEAAQNMMSVLQMGVAALGATEPLARDNSHEANLKKAIKLTGQMATLVANGYRAVSGKATVPGDPNLGHAANFLYMLHGEKPNDLFAKVMNLTFILYAEHGYNASTFTARVVASTLAGLHSAVAAAIGALHGNLHGGANEAVMDDMLSIGTSDRAEGWVRERLASKHRIMGFGHREYKTGDTRAAILGTYVDQLAELTGKNDLAKMQRIMRETVLNEKGLHPNVDFPAAPIYYMMDIPIPLYTPIFAAARITGWSAHVIEQHDGNRLIRPRSDYNGPAPRPYVPIAQR